MYRVNSSNLIEANYTPSGTLYFTYKKLNKENDEVAFDQYISELDKYETLSGLLFYKTPNDYFYLLKSNSSKVKSSGKGQIDEKANFYPLVTHKELNSPILNEIIDEFWSNNMEKKLTHIDQCLPNADKIINKLIDVKTKASEKFLCDFNRYMDIVENPQSSTEIIIGAKAKIEQLVKLNLKIVDIYHKIENLTDEINLIQSYF